VELADEETIPEYVLDLRSLLSRGSLTERKAFIKSFVKEVQVTGKQVVLSYSIPASQKGISREEVSVPPIAHNGGRWGTRTSDLLRDMSPMSYHYQMSITQSDVLLNHRQKRSFLPHTFTPSPQA